MTHAAPLPRTIAEHPDRLAQRSSRERHVHLRRGAPLGCVRRPEQQHVGPRLDEADIGSLLDAGLPRLSVIRVRQNHRDLFLRYRELLAQHERRLDDREERVDPVGVGNQVDRPLKRGPVLELEHSPRR